MIKQKEPRNKNKQTHIHHDEFFISWVSSYMPFLRFFQFSCLDPTPIFTYFTNAPPHSRGAICNQDYFYTITKAVMASLCLGDRTLYFKGKDNYALWSLNRNIMNPQQIKKGWDPISVSRTLVCKTVSSKKYEECNFNQSFDSHLWHLKSCPP